jgi:hypothetical protein
MRLLIASIAAVAVQPVVFFARVAPDYFASSTPVYGLGTFLAAVVVVSAAAVFVLGIPAFLLLRKLGRANWTSLATAGLCLGMLPAALSWPRTLEGYSSGQNWHGKYVDTYVHGVPTSYAWLTYAESVLNFGLHGLVGALTFYAVWRCNERAAEVPPKAAG